MVHLALTLLLAPAPPAPLSASATPGAALPLIEPVGAAEPIAGFRAVTLIEKLDHPWSLAFLPDGAMLITERPGRLRIVRNGQLDPAPIAGIPPVAAIGQGGLMDISLHPNFARNHWVYFTFAAGNADANHTCLGRGTFDGARLTEVSTLFEVAQLKQGGQHFGSRILWLPDGTMLLAVGDGGNPPVSLGPEPIRNQAQNLAAHLGKIHRLDENGRPPPDNPFAGREGAAPSIFTLGHRNIQGLARDPDNGSIWATEHGARGGDELNFILPGANYGWPKATFSIEYWGPKISEVSHIDGMADPRYAWTPCIAPSGLAIYRGDKFPAWNGRILAGGLVSKDIRLVTIENGRGIAQRSIPIGERVRDVRQGPDGFVYVLTDEDAGHLLRLEPVP